MKTLLLSQSDLHEIVSRVGVDRMMDELIARLRTALIAFDTAETEIPVRAGFHYEAPVPGLIEWMPLLAKNESVLMKIVGYHPDSPDKLRLPTILSTLSRYDPTSGHLLALVDGTFLTAMRTGAASALASQALAKPDSATIGLIGCGAQAVTQLHALNRMFPVTDVLIHDVDPTALKTFRDRVANFSSNGFRIHPTPVSELVASSDILCVATSVPIGAGPVFAAQETRPWLHVNAVGSDFPGKIECPRDLLLRSFVCPDVPGQAMREGECQQLTAAQIGADFATLIKDAESYEALRLRTSVFDSTGWALEDQVALSLLLEIAQAFDLGTDIQIENVSMDPRSPYEFLSPVCGAPRLRQIG